MTKLGRRTAKNVGAGALWVVTVALVLAWIWLGGWRWAATAGLVAFVALVVSGLAATDKPAGDPPVDWSK